MANPIGRFVIRTVACVLFSGCASTIPGIDCGSGRVLNAQMVLVENRVATINGASSQIGTFKLTNEERRSIEVSGWTTDGRFLAEYPVASLWRFDRVWEPIVPLIGSFTSRGDRVLRVPPGESATLLARTDFGLPVGANRVRLLLKAHGGDCVVSAPFDVLARQ